MVKQKALLVFALCWIVIAGCLALSAQPSLNKHRSQWERSRPSIYYLEVIETQHATDMQHQAVIVQDNHPTMVMWNNEPLTGTIFEELTIESIFDVAIDWCISKDVECVMDFDKEFHYLKDLAVYDWLAIEVIDFVPCDSLEICISTFEQKSVSIDSQQSP